MKIKKIYLTKENLLKIQDLDDLYYVNTITGINWYLERYNENNFAYVIVDEHEKYCGYIMAAPITKEFYNAITSGVIINDVYVNPKMFINKSNYYYIYSIVILEEYRKKGFGIKLLNELLKEVDK